MIKTRRIWNSFTFHSHRDNRRLIEFPSVCIMSTNRMFWAIPLMSLISCMHDQPAMPIPVDKICFQRQVLPLFVNYCSRVEGGCHDAGNPRISLVDHAGIMRGIQEGNADGSWFFHTIGLSMPPGAEPQLNVEQVGIIRKWIDQGAPNSHCENLPCDTSRLTYSNSASAIFSNYCNGCHDSWVYPNALGFSSYDRAKNSISADPEKFLRSIRYSAGAQKNMPPSCEMNPCDRMKIESWVNRGMPY